MARRKNRTQGLTQGSIDVEEARESVSQARERAHELDCTPLPISFQAMQNVLKRWTSLKTNKGKPEVRVADVFAGAGSWCVSARKAAAEVGVKVHLTAIELREEERKNLDHNADVTIIGDFTKIREIEPFDLIVGNPAFSRWGDALPIMLECLRPGGMVAVLMHNGLGQRGEEGHALFGEYGPKEQWRIAGAVAFRGDRINPKKNKKFASDARDYSVWVWDKKCGSKWTTMNLPWLPTKDRGWKIKPGTEWAREFVQTDIFGQEIE